MLLTQKQEKYVQGLVAGLSQRQAYIQAGYSTEGKSNNYIDKEASLLAKNRKVTVRYQELMAKHLAKALWTREDAINTLKWLVNQSVVSIKEHDDGYVRQGTSTALINAIQELNKLEMVYAEDTKRLSKAQADKATAEARLAESKAEALENMGVGVELVIVDEWSDDNEKVTS